jgi:hypothetical protein
MRMAILIPNLTSLPMQTSAHAGLLCKTVVEHPSSSGWKLRGCIGNKNGKLATACEVIPIVKHPGMPTGKFDQH